MPKKLVVLGDLNADDDALAMALFANGLTDQDGNWCAHDAHFVQVGDIVNRGAYARAALERLHRLQKQAPAFNSHVSVLLGNHEAMVTLGNLAWCSPEEILEFAGSAERSRYEVARSDAIMALLHQAQHSQGTAPILGQIRAWEEANVPGHNAYKKAMGKSGAFGKYIRSLPVAICVGNILLTHGGIGIRIAHDGLEALNHNVWNSWAKGPDTEMQLTPDSLLLADDGPLWNRKFALGKEYEVGDELRSVLASLGASMKVVGHTRTEHMQDGKRGHACPRFDGRLVCVDTGIGSTSGSMGALVIEDNQVISWRPDQSVVLGPVPELAELEHTQPSRSRR